MHDKNYMKEVNMENSNENDLQDELPETKRNML